MKANTYCLGATQDALIPTSEWARRARELLAHGRASKAAYEREMERSLAPASIWPGNTFETEDITDMPDNWLYTALSDERLNRGLGNLLEGAGDVVLGRESGNTLVDLGTSNIPGVGAASILAAGGMPGLVDAVGLGELRNMKRIPKYTYEFVKEFFGDKGLKNLDNALTMYPKAEEAALKSKLAKMSKKESKAYEAKLRLQQQAQQKQAQQQKQQKKKTETPKQETITAEPVKEQPKPEVAQAVKETVQGGPNKWRENGWDPNVRSDIFYSKFGNNLSDNSKRDVFVTDSLANRWAKQIRGEGREGSLADAVITDALSRADARHNLSNYDEAARGFYNDIKKNIASGNMPGTAVTFGPKYKNNIRTNRDTPTLVIPLSEHPKADYPLRIWSDEQEGPDLYEIVFRPKADDILNSLNPDYWLYNNR